MPKVDPSLIDVFFPQHDGYPEKFEQEDTHENMMGAAEEGGAKASEFPSSLWIEPSQWKEVAKYNTENKLWARHFIDRFTNQNPTHECTCHSLRVNMEAARNRQRRIVLGDGPIKDQRLEMSAKSVSVWLSPLSVYAEANPGKRGGANVQQVLRIAAKRGMLPEPIQPRDYGFKHTLHGTTGSRSSVTYSNGPWVPVSKFPEGWQETAKHFMPLEYIFPKSYEEGVCLLLHGLVVSVGRNGHAIPYFEWDPDEDLFPYPDSYDVIRYDSKSTARRCIGNGSFAVFSMKQSDDWLKPAG